MRMSGIPLAPKRIIVLLGAGAIVVLGVLALSYAASLPAPSEPAVPATTDGEAPLPPSEQEAAAEMGPPLSESDEAEALEQDLDATNLTDLDAELEDVDRELGP